MEDDETKTVIVTLDVEPDYPPYLGDSRLGVDKALPRILELLKTETVPADVFLLAELCKFNPSLPKDIVKGGFRLGNHGLRHRLLCVEDVPTQWREVRDSTKILQEASGQKVTSFRAPNFSFDGDTLMCLERAHYHIDSSVLPGRRMRRWLAGTVYDFRGAPTSPYHASVADVTDHGASSVLEIPVSENPLVPQTPIGGGYLNTHGPTKAIEAVRGAKGTVVVLVFHPWEFVDFSRKFSRLPRWMVAGCREDISALSEFVAGLRDGGWKFSTLEDFAEFYQRTQASGEPKTE